MEFLDDDLDVLDLIENGFPRRVYERANYYEEMDNLTFFQRFRLTKPTAQHILVQIEHLLEFDEDKNNCMTPINQLLLALRFYATDGHLSSVADFMGVHVATACRVVKKVSYALAMLKPRYIKMPENHDIIETQNKFFQIASFPRVIGCIDGTHVKIQSPGGADGEIYRNRKGYFSVNVQVVGDSNLKVQNIVARWPGSQHDNTMFTHSNIKFRFESGEFQNCVLLGDSGYALRNYLLTPITNPVGRGETLYNEAHIRTRNSIERLFGVMKRRFPVLAYGMRLKIETVLVIIVAVAVLHNIAVDMNEDLPPFDNEDALNYLIEMGNIQDQPIEEQGQPQNFVFRNEIINYFQNLH